MTDEFTDFEAQQDLETLVRADKIKDDPSRIARAKNFATRRAEELKDMSDGLPRTPNKGFNGAVSGSRMSR